MSQPNLDDDDLFGEAATEIRDDVEASLEAARDALPVADEIWDVESENTLGVLNALKTALDTGDAADHLRDAKKWYTMGKRADAFDDADDLKDEIEAVEELISDINDAHDQIGDLTATIPQLRSQLSETTHDSDAGNPEEAQA
jgi:wobble nucleotide-excising tRNase